MADLVTLDQVSLRLWPDQATAPTLYDEILEEIITQVSAQAEALRGAPFASAERTEYLDGRGGCALFLGNGPLVSVAGSWTVEYSDAGDGSRDETLTEVEAYERIEGGLAADGFLGGGWLERLGAAWPVGQKNIKVTATCGFATVPPPVQQAVINETMHEFRSRDMAGFQSTAIGEFRARILDREDRERAFVSSISPYRIMRF